MVNDSRLLFHFTFYYRPSGLVIITTNFLSLFLISLCSFLFNHYFYSVQHLVPHYFDSFGMNHFPLPAPAQSASLKNSSSERLVILILQYFFSQLNVLPTADCTSINSNASSFGRCLRPPLYHHHYDCLLMLWFVFAQVSYTHVSLFMIFYNSNTRCVSS